MPELALAILNDGGFPQMKGIAVGNGLFSWDLVMQSDAPFLWRHGALSDAQYEQWRGKCGNPPIYNATTAWSNVIKPPCVHASEQFSSLSIPLNMYDIYGLCQGKSVQSQLRDGLKAGRSLKEMWADLLRMVGEVLRPAHPAIPRTPKGVNPSCIDGKGATEYLARPDVKKALHVDPSPNTWYFCASPYFVTYNHNWKYFAPDIYRQMVNQYRILIYYGDTDLALNYIHGQYGVEAIGAAVVPTGRWQPWEIVAKDGPQIGGYTTTFATTGGLHFTTVKGAGHMVPQWKPQAAHTLIKDFLSGDWSLYPGQTGVSLGALSREYV